MEPSSKTLQMLSVEPGTVIANRYKVLEQLGTGGMGVVFKVQDQELDEVLALKLLHPHLAQDEEVFARFRSEVLVARSLSHPNIVRVHDMGRATEGFSYISMEFVAGESLRDRLDRLVQANNNTNDPPLSFEEALSNLYHVCCGVAYAHSKGVIHRDLKPANVMIDEKGEVKLADFGTARIQGMDRSLTRTGQSIGTPDYMAPEQIRGEVLDARCDIYALGIIGYELAVGDKPFQAESSVAVAFKHLNEKVPNFASAESGIPTWYQDVILKATEKDPEQRFATGHQFVAALTSEAPELTATSMHYIGDYDATATSGGGATSTSPGAVETTTAGSETKGSPTPDSQKFQMGSAEQNRASAEWKLGSASDQPAVPLVSTDKDGKKRINPTLMGVVAFFCLLGVIVATVRFHGGLNNSVKEMFLGWQTSSGTDYSGLARVFGVDLSEGTGAVPELTGEEKEREALTKELLGVPLDGGEAGEPGAKPAVSTAKTDQKPAEQKKPAEETKTAKATTPAETKPAETKPEAKPAEATPAKAPKKTPATETKVAKVVPEPAPPKPPKKDPPPPPPPEPTPVVPLTASLYIKEGSTRVSDDNFSVDKLYKLKWGGDIKNYPKMSRSALRKKAKEEFYLNVFDPKQKRLVSKLRVASAQPSKTAGVVAIEGNLSGLRSKQVGAGVYRLDLVRNGEVLTSREISLYKARVTLSAGSAATGASGAGAGGQKIKVVTGPSYVPPTGGTTVPTPATPPASQVPVVSPPAATPPAIAQRPLGTTPSFGTTPPAPTSMPPTAMPVGGFGQPSNTMGGSLPPAKKPAQPVSPPPVASGSGTAGTSPFNVSSIELNRQPYPPQQGSAPVVGTMAGQQQGFGQPAPIAPAEVYRGTISMPRTEGGPTEDLTFELKLRIQDKSITGSANIAGYSPLSVSGQLFPRGLEMTLRSEQIGVRLSGAKRGNSMRGRFFIPAQKIRGSWSASK